MTGREGPIVVLTGAGVSAESGLGTFRDRDGLWTQYDLREVATPEGYARDPSKVLDFYNARRRNCLEAEPNAAHHALARLAAARDDVLIVTQNVDDLHERAGAGDTLHMHGELLSALCAACGARSRWDGDMTLGHACLACAAEGRMRPDVVWFGEIPSQMDRILDALGEARLFAAIGTSGEVYPAAGFVAKARAAGAHCVEINLEPTGGPFHERLTGTASETVPRWVESLL